MLSDCVGFDGGKKWDMDDIWMIMDDVFDDK
jgi:hypothetical protein